MSESFLLRRDLDTSIDIALFVVFLFGQRGRNGCKEEAQLWYARLVACRSAMSLA